MICGSCGMRMDGAAVLACKTRMYDIAQAGEIPVDLGDGEPADRQGPRRRHGAVLGEVQGDQAVPPAGLRAAGGRQGVPHLAGADERHPQGVALHQLRLLRLGVQRDGVRSRVPRPAGAREGHALRRRPARRARRSSGSRSYSGEHGIWECTRCFFCNERCPKGVDPRDAIAKLGAEAIKEGIDRDMGAKHAKWFIRSTETTGWLRETELVPKTQGVVSSDQADEVRDQPRAAQQGRARVPAARREGRRRGARPAQARARAGPRTARSATCRASTRSRSSRTATRRPRPSSPDRAAAVPAGRILPARRGAKAERREHHGASEA